MGHKCNPQVSLTEKQRKITQKRGHCDQGGSTGMLQSQAKDYHHPPEAGRGEGWTLPWRFQRTQALPTP